MAAKRSSQYGMLWMMPFDLVAEVTCCVRPRLGPFERVAHDAVAAFPREDRLLDRHLLGAPPVEPAADLGVFALVVLAHHQHVDVGGPAAGERRLARP